MENIIKKWSKEWDKTTEGRKYEWALKSWSVSVRERDLQICVNCGSTEDLQAHHIIPKKERPDLALDLNNGITYCLPCHKETESWGDCSFH